MKKETIVTIVVGSIMGVIVAFAVITTTKEKRIEKKKIIVPHLTPTIVLATPSEKKQPLAIKSPENNYLSKENTITIKGTTNKQSLLIIQSPFSEKILQNTSFDFSTDFPVSLGENTINITAYKEKEIQQKTLHIYYFEKEE